MQTAHSSNNVSTSGSQPAFPNLKPGQKLAGCYVLRGEKYACGATRIWLAHDEVLGKDVALHFIPQAVRVDEKAMDDLRHQIKRNRQLIHPNILRIYDFIEEKEWAAISTDAIEGEFLAEMRAKKTGGFFEVADVKPWLAQLFQTLDEAHRIHLVHGDLSPEHVFIDQTGRLFTTDFGIGRCIRDAQWRAGAPTGATPPVENVSPQLLDGQPPSPADDLYAAGVLMHELLTGQPPFTDPDIAGKVRNLAAPAVMERRAQLQKAGGPVPPSWEKVIAACLEKRPEQRPKNLADVSARLALAKPDAEPAEAAEPAVETTLPAKPAAAETPLPEPVIPVVKKAWDGAKKTAPAIAGAALQKTRPAESSGNEILASEIEASESDDLSEHETILKNAISENYRNLGARRSAFPAAGLAAAAAAILVGIGIYGVSFGGLQKQQGSSDPAPLVHTESTSEAPQYAAVKNPISETAPEKTPVESPVVAIETVPVAKTIPAPPPVEVSTFAPKPEIDSAIVLAANAKPAKPAATPVPAAAASEATASPSVAAKTAALDAARKSVDEWAQAHQTLLKKKEQAEAAIAEARKALDEKMKSAAPMLKAGDEVAALRQKREAEMRAAELAAEEARKAAEQKVRAAEEAKRAVASIERENKDKLAGQKKAEAELDEIKKTIAENERLAAESARMADGALAKRTEQLATVKQKEQEVAMAMAAAEIEIQKKKEMEDKRSRIMKEMDDAKRLFEERMKALESSLKDPDGGFPPPVKTPVEKPQAEVKPAAPAVLVPAAPAPETPKPAASAAPALPAAESTLLAKMETPPVPAPEPKPAAPAPGGPTTNSLGMAFIPVGDIQFAIWPTRLKDFEIFAAATNLKSNLWRDPGFKQGADHPVVNVTWMEAMAFCKWLTFKEQRDGLLPAGKIYRLPTDIEWSKGVGLPEESGKTAEARDMGVPDVYPWGTAWPPPQGSGNYTGEETGSDVAIKGYSDGFPWTSPVGSFQPNKYGLYDMGGNVWQWVMDAWNTDSTSKVLRGGSWYNGALKLSLLSSCRVHAALDSSTDNYGFRCVVASESPKSIKR